MKKALICAAAAILLVIGALVWISRPPQPATINSERIGEDDSPQEMHPLMYKFIDDMHEVMMKAERERSESP